jgi:hypothetical protein
VIRDFTAEQRQLWARCVELWELSLTREADPIRAALHPDYTGWVTGTDRPHDREAAVAAVGPGSPRVLDYQLTPLSVNVFDGRTGVIHYRYVARLDSAPGPPATVGGRWTEVYLRDDEAAWIMIAVSGGPDGER